MNDEVEILVLEQLRRQRSDIKQLISHHDDIASLRAHVDRIERRLELIEAGEK